MGHKRRDSVPPIHPRRKKKPQSTSHQSQAAADSKAGLIPNLPWEIIEEILKRLPVKSLLKFRCVSRSWLSLISDPNFIRTHFENSLNDKSYTHHRILSISFESPRYLTHCSLHSLLNNPVTEVKKVSPRPNLVLGSCNGLVVGSCNGLVVGSCNGLVCTKMAGIHLLLWNPITRELRKLPDPDMPSGYHTYGFAFDELTNDYKIVNNTCASSSLRMVKVYSLKTNYWKRIEDLPGFPLSKTCKVVNRKLHWPAKLNLFSTGMYIISLDIRTEVFDKIELPFHGIDDTHPVLGVLGGCLSVLMSYESWGDLWILKEYGLSESWSKVANISCNNLNNNLYHVPVSESEETLRINMNIIASKPVYMLNNGEILLLIGGNFAVYNLKDEGLKCPVTSNFNTCFESVIYIENLVSPFGDGGLGAQYE